MSHTRNSPTPNFTATKFLPIPQQNSRKQNHSSKYASYNGNPQQISQLETTSKQLKQRENMIPLPQLLSRLSLYRSIKQIQNSLSNETSQRLWRDSPCCIPYSNKNVSMDKVKKFQIGSIYHKDNINEQKKVFTEFQKPQLLLKNFKRQIQQASRSRQKSMNKHNLLMELNNTQNNMKNKKALSMRKSTRPLDSKFYQIPIKIQLKYDRNGSRSIYPGEYDVHQIYNKIISKKSNFTSSSRMDLALPLNFNPGPGKYFNHNHDENIQSARYSQRQRSSNKILNNIQQIQTERNTKINDKQQIKTERNTKIYKQTIDN